MNYDNLYGNQQIIVALDGPAGHYEVTPVSLLLSASCIGK